MDPQNLAMVKPWMPNDAGQPQLRVTTVPAELLQSESPFASGMGNQTITMMDPYYDPSSRLDADHSPVASLGPLLAFIGVHLERFGNNQPKNSMANLLRPFLQLLASKYLRTDQST